MPALKLATFNINKIAKRLAVLLEWLTKASPDIVCLQELKVPDSEFPLRQIEAAGYGARWIGQPSWNGVAILAQGMTPVETCRQLPGDPSDTHSRYLEAAAHGVLVGCLNAAFAFFAEPQLMSTTTLVRARYRSQSLAATVLAAIVAVPLSKAAPLMEPNTIASPT